MNWVGKKKITFIFQKNNNFKIDPFLNKSFVFSDFPKKKKTKQKSYTSNLFFFSFLIILDKFKKIKKIKNFWNMRLLFFF
jgi:hypothetical protein